MDMLDEEEHHLNATYKPDWSPDLMLSQMYMGHLVGFRKSLFMECDGFAEGYDGAQDYDLILRMSEKAKYISHISEKILYSWRMLPTSTSINQTRNLMHRLQERKRFRHIWIVFTGKDMLK